MLGAATSARVGLDLLPTRNFRIVLGGVQQHCSHAFEAFLEGDDYVRLKVWRMASFSWDNNVKTKTEKFMAPI